MSHTVVDFETMPIDGWKPPLPIGMAVYEVGIADPYYVEAKHIRSTLKSILKRGDTLIMHNAMFDAGVMAYYYQLKPNVDYQFEDTLIMAYLHMPNAEKLSLKVLAEQLLGMPPDEQNELNEWILENTKCRALGSCGKYIHEAPLYLVSKYAVGDVVRTWGLYKYLLPKIDDMSKAYHLEKKVLPILLGNTLQGVRVDRSALVEALVTYNTVIAQCEQYIQGRLGTEDSPLNLNNKNKVMERLIKLGFVYPDKIKLTKTGKYKADKLSFDECVKLPALAKMLKYLASLKTCLTTFIKPWYEMSETDGKIHTTWNQTKQAEHGGTRTGRLSSSPNFQNMPREFDELFTQETWPLDFAYKGLPNCRAFILPDSDDEVLLSRDYSQQEIRIFAHYENGSLLNAYLKDPWTDMHDLAGDAINKGMGLNLGRKAIKTLNLGLLYGMGIDLLQQQVQKYTSIKVDREIVQACKNTVISLFTGWAGIQRAMKQRAANGLPIKTFGGRTHYCEEPRFDNEMGRVRSFEYKMLNTLIQGSAADCTKQAMTAINDLTFEGKRPRLVLQVHDELVYSVPKSTLDYCNKLIAVAMESVDLKVPMLTEGKVGGNFGRMYNIDKRGKLTDLGVQIRGTKYGDNSLELQ